MRFLVQQRSWYWWIDTLDALISPFAILSLNSVSLWKKKSCNRILVLSLLEPEEYKKLRATLQLQIASEMEGQWLKA